MSIFRSLAGAIKARGLDTSGIYNSGSDAGALASNLQTPGDNSFTKARAMRRQRIQDALGLGRGKRSRGALDALFNRGARGERRRQRMLAAGAAPSIAEQEGTSEVSGMMEGAQASGGVIGAASSAASAQSQPTATPPINPSVYRQGTSSITTPRAAYIPGVVEDISPEPYKRPTATNVDFASGGRATFDQPDNRFIYRPGGGVGAFADGRGVVPQSQRMGLVGANDMLHTGEMNYRNTGYNALQPPAPQAQMNTNLNYGSLFSR